HLDPRGYEVVPVAAPNDTEKSHHYLWRFWQAVPSAGRISVFDRTWYGRVLVERVEGFCLETEWRRAYREINEFEQQLTNYGAVVVKFWLHIDKDEQLRRFREREETPEKRWKITDEDWRNREKWDAYKVAVDEMLFRTSTRKAPWTVVAANSKEYARWLVLKTVTEAISSAL
ncbi:MAG: phosphate--AMP phosphotransferase, partial [Negativicutes bacterium]|nr:phosphate--AMP phosphotransferase [Negativicutes bacterium]